MPLYDYECTKCDNKFDVLCSIDEGLKDKSCPKCKSISHKKVTGIKLIKGLSSPGKSLL